MNHLLFLSDFHLGSPSYEESLEREKRICQLLDRYRSQISELFFVGDVFDFWFEYRTVAPKGFYRLIGKLCELADQGIQIHFFKGNHDMWMSDLFQRELKATIHSHEYIAEVDGKKIFIHHGDGLGPGDHRYKFLKLFFRSSICQFLFRWMHPDIAIAIANFFSHSSRKSQSHVVETYHGNQNEWLYTFAKNELRSQAIDYFIFGHRHLPIYTTVEQSHTKYINLGDWLTYDTYAYYDGKEVSLYQYGTDKSNNDFNPNA